jgi:hypothetical protein
VTQTPPLIYDGGVFIKIKIVKLWESCFHTTVHEVLNSGLMLVKKHHSNMTDEGVWFGSGEYIFSIDQRRLQKRDDYLFAIQKTDRCSRVDAAKKCQ